MALSGTINGYVSNQPDSSNPFSFYVTWSATQNIIWNTSTVTVKVYWKTNNTFWTWDTVDSDRKAKASIGNSTTGEWAQRYNCNPWPSNPYCIKTFSTTIQHDESGKASVVIKAYADGTAQQGGPGYSYINDTTITLDSIDRAAPTVLLSTSETTATNITLKATSSTTCDRWDYSTDNGVTWTNYSTASGTSASKTLSGLTPNTTYNIKVRARKSTNQVYGYSAASSVKTLGNSVISSISTFTADNETAKITMSVTVYNTSYTHTLVLKNGYTTVLTISSLSLTNGSNTITLTSSQRSTVLAAMSRIKRFTGIFELKTYSGGEQIGTVSVSMATVQTTSTNSSPIFTAFTYEDSNATSVDVTGNNQILIQNISTLKITATAATAKNGATISSYSAVAGSATASSVNTVISVGRIRQTGTVPVIVTAIDSRGYTTSVTVNITVVAYEAIDITDYFMRRINEVEDATQVSIAGDITPVQISGVNKNSLQYLRYRYKKTSDSSYNAYTGVTVEYDDDGFIFESDEWISLDTNYSYSVQFLVADKLTTDTVTITIPQGTPLLSFRQKKVGVNNREPAATLDVVGDIQMNGVKVVGYVADIDAVDANMLTGGGYYLVQNGTTDLHYPTNIMGFLEVYVNASGFVMQKYTTYTSGAQYIRTRYFNGNWYPWKTVNLT